MSTRAWVIWIVVLVLLIGGGFGAYWYFTNIRVSADVASSTTTSTTSNTVMTVKTGWNFVSFPYNSVTTVTELQAKLSTSVDLQALYRWNGSTWSDVIAEGLLKPGTGYLAYFSQGTSVDLGDTAQTSYSKAEVPLVANQWQLVGKPLMQNIVYKSSGSSSTEFVPYSDFSVMMADGTTMTVLDAIAKGYISAPLFMENDQPSYSYLKLYDLSSNSVPDFSAFWVLPKSSDVESILFTSDGTSSGTTVSRDNLETGDALTAPSS